jgi:hypothetical protein
VGYSGKLSYSAGRWSTGGPTAVPFLIVDVHDSGIATVDYRSADAGGGRFFLGYEPRIYFDERDAGAPVDIRAEAQGYARWLRDAEGTDVDPAELQRLMASPDGAPPEDDVVEDTVERLCTLSGLPVPDWPTDDDAPAG